MMKNYTTVERESYRVLVSFGIDENIAKDCIASRNAQELAIVIKFLGRYGNYINR
ncbi:MAG: hypothetical protein ACQEWU_05275 [Bacillota bacterium]